MRIRDWSSDVCSSDRYDAEFDWIGDRNPKPEGVGFYYLDHLTHNVYRGNMDQWWDFYRDLFGFKQIHFIDIDGRITGLVSRAKLARASCRARVCQYVEITGVALS